MFKRGQIWLKSDGTFSFRVIAIDEENDEMHIQTFFDDNGEEYWGDVSISDYERIVKKWGEYPQA